MKENVLQILLYTHIAAGTMALVSGLIPLLVKKGGKIHKKSGMVFFWAMMAVSFSAFVISIAKTNSFLLAIAVFSFYMNYTGYRVLKNKKGKLKWYDWVALVAAAGFALYMIASMNIVLIVFGGILSVFIFRDVLVQVKGEEAMKQAVREKVITHIGRMVGTYIAAVTAFAVVNINFVKPGWLVWLLPTVIGTPIIIYWSRKWGEKLKLH